MRRGLLGPVLGIVALGTALAAPAAGPSAPVDVDPGNVSAAHPPLLAADPVSSDIYMVWNASADVQNTVPGYNGDLDLFLRVSHDAGRTWSDRVVLSDETLKANQYEPGSPSPPTAPCTWPGTTSSTARPTCS